MSANADSGKAGVRASPTSVASDLDLDSLVEAGRSAHLSGDFNGAKVILRRALYAAERSGDSVAMAEAFTWLGQAARRLGHYEEARRLGERALEIKRVSGHTRALFDSYNALGLLAWEETRLEDAVELYDSARAAAMRNGDSLDVAKVAANRALVHLDMGNFREARAGLSHALSLARYAEDDRVVTLVLLNLATLDEKIGHPTRARDGLEQALALGRQVGDRSAEAYALGELAVAHQALGEPGVAFVYMDSALTITRDQGNRQDEAENLALLAGLHRQAGRYRRALDLLAEARALHGELGLPSDLASDARQEAEIHARLGNHPLARESAQAALDAHTRAGIRFEQLADLLFLADLAERGGDPDEAQRWMARARVLADTLDARTARVAVALTDARLQSRRGRYEKTVSILHRAARDLRGGGYGSEAEAATLRARALAALGRPEDAASASKEAVDALERTRRGYGSGVLRTSFLADRDEVYVDRIGILVRLGRLEEAFEAADARRGRALLERLPAALDTTSTRGTLVDEAARAQELLAWIDTLVVRLEALDLVSPHQRTPALMAESELLFTELQNTRADYDEALIRASEGSSALGRLLGVTATSAGVVREALEDHELLIEYFVAPDSLFLFALSPDTVRVVIRALDATNLRSRVRVARDLVSRLDSDLEGGSAVLSGLHGLLVEPIRETGALKGVDRVYVVPHGELSYLPFAALKRTPEGPYLVEEFTLVHLPSASALPALRERARERARKAGAMEGVSFAPFPRELPGTVREVEAVRRHQSHWGVRLGSQASESAMREALASGLVVHAATHGILNAWNPMFSRILLEADPDPGSAGDGRLELHEVVASTVASPLVFLSGCETGLGTIGATGFLGGDDYATLAQAFLYAGAQSVVATLWRIPDDGAAAFAETFFRGLGGSGDPAGALATTQRVMLRDPRYASPFYWAGYRLDGLGTMRPTSAFPRVPQESHGGAVPTI